MCIYPGTITFVKASKSGGNQSGPNCVEVGAFTKAAASVPNGACVEVGSYRKASHSNPSGNCVEVAHTKATKSGAAGHCVEPGQATAAQHLDCNPETCTTPGIEPGDIVVRDSKGGEGSPLVVFRPREWRSLVERVVAGLDAEHRASNGPHPWFIADPRTSVVLWFTDAEWDAFRDGCTKSEFDYAPLTAVPA